MGFLILHPGREVLIIELLALSLLVHKLFLHLLREFLRNAGHFFICNRRVQTFLADQTQADKSSDEHPVVDVEGLGAFLLAARLLVVTNDVPERAVDIFDGGVGRDYF